MSLLAFQFSSLPSTVSLSILYNKDQKFESCECLYCMGGGGIIAYSLNTYNGIDFLKAAGNLYLIIVNWLYNLSSLMSPEVVVIAHVRCGVYKIYNPMA